MASSPAPTSPAPSWASTASSACHPRHRLQRLAATRALIALLGWRAAEPATARYVCHVLTQQLGALPEYLSNVVARLLGPVLHALSPAEGAQVAEGTENWPAVTTEVRAGGQASRRAGGWTGCGARSL